MSEINVIYRTQQIIVDAPTRSVSVLLAGPAGPAGPSGGVTSPTINEIVVVTQAQYDALGSGRSPTILYVIAG